MAAGIGRHKSSRVPCFFTGIEGGGTKSGIGNEFNVIQVISHVSHFIEGKTDFTA